MEDDAVVQSKDAQERVTMKKLQVAKNRSIFLCSLGLMPLEVLLLTLARRFLC